MNQKYAVLYSTYRRRWAEHFMANSTVPNMVLWLMGNGEWQVRVYGNQSA